jgi:hypothetical protein
MIITAASRAGRSARATQRMMPASATGALNSTADCRLTLVTGTPILTSTQSAKTSLFLTTKGGNKLALWNGESWSVDSFAEVSASLAALTANTNYDVFSYASAGALLLEFVAWTNSTTRATALADQHGVPVKTGDAKRRYMGTIRINASGGQCDFIPGGVGVAGSIGVWNAYNRVSGKAVAQEGALSWTYTTQTWRQLNNSALNQVSIVSGLAEDIVDIHTNAFVANTTGGVICSTGVGVNVTNANSSQLFGGAAISSSVIALCPSRYVDVPPVGWNTFAMLEISQATGTTTWFGDANLTIMQSGMVTVFRF